MSSELRPVSKPAPEAGTDGLFDFARFADLLPVLLTYCDRDLVYRYCNAHFTEWFGLRTEELVGRPIAEVLGPEAYAVVEPALRGVLAGKPATLEVHMPYRHGPHRDVRIEAVPHLAKDGEIPGFYAMIVDLSERARGEASRAWLAAIVEHAHDAVVGKDLEGRIMSWNGAAERIYGYRAEEMVGESIGRLFPDDRRDEMRSILESIRRGEPVLGRETVRVRKDGRHIEVIVSVSPVFGPGGKVVGASAVTHDMSEFKRTERAMRESEARLKLATEAAEVGIFDWNVGSDQIRWDRRVRSIWGIGDDEGVDYGLFLSGVHPDDVDRTQAAVDCALDPGGDGKYHAEYRVRNRRDGGVRWVAATGQVTFGDDKPLRMVGIVRDISARKQADAELKEWGNRLGAQLELTRHAEERLRRSNLDLEEFTGIVTHDLRNPLGSALFTVELMRETLGKKSPELLEKQVELLHDALSSMDRMVKDLHAQALDRREKPGLEAIDLAEVVEEAGHGAALMLEKHGGTLVTETTLPRLAGNRVLLVQLVSNLVDNAIKYRSDAPPVIIIRADRDAGDHRITVADNGRGIPPEDQERIFSTNARGTNSDGTPGSGLGLAICRRIMEAHGGTITLSGSSQEGTAFELRFPPADRPAASA